MSHKIISLLSCICLAFLGAITMSCGSSSSSGSAGCTGGPYDVVGDWTLDVGSSSGPGIINSSGLAVFFQTSILTPAPGDVVVLPNITGTCSFSGTGNAYSTFVGGGGSASDSVQGNVNSATSITGKISNGNSFSLVPNAALSSGSVAGLSGAGWLGEIEGAEEPVIWDIVLSLSGSGNSMSFTGAGLLPSGATCNINGTFNQEGGNSANLNVFDTSITFGEGCPFTSVSGLGFESTSDYFGLNGNAQGAYLYAASSSSAAVLEIFKLQ